MSKKIKNTLKRGLTLSLAGGTAVTGVAAATGTSVVTTYAETLSNLKQVSVSDGWYTFASVQDESYVLDVNGSGKNSNLRLYKKNDSENQKFYIESVGNNEYKIKTGASNGSLVLNAVNGNNTAGDNVNQYSYDGSIKDEKWKIYQDASGNYVFVSSTGDKVLDICGKKMANNTNIWLWEYYGANTQKWKLNAVKSANDTPTISSLKPVTIDNGWYSVTSSANSSLALEVKDGANANGANIYGNTKNNSKNQEFYFEQISGNEYAIKTAVSDKARALDVVGGNSANGINVRQWDYSDRKAVHWKLYTDDEGNYVLVSSTGDKVLDLTGAKSTAGTNVWTWDYYGASTQEWKLTKIDKNPLSSLTQVSVSDGWYTFASVQDESYVLDVNGSGKNSNLRLYKKNDSENQKFYIESVGNNEYKIKTGASNGSLVLNAVNGNNTAGDNVNQYSYDGSIKDEKWKIYQDASGNYVFVSSTGDKVLDICGKKMANNTNIWLWEYYGANTQKWKLNAVKSANDTPTISSLKPVTIDNGWYSVTSSANSSLALEVKDGANANGANIYGNTKNNSKNQEFYFEQISGNEYAIKTAVSDKARALDVVGGNSANGINVRQWDYSDRKAVHWKLYTDDEGNYVLVSSTGDKVLDLTGAKSTAGTNVWTWDYYGASTQEWKLTKIDKNPLSSLTQVSVSDGWYTFASVQDESYVLDVNGSGKNSNLRLYKKNDSENQKFYIESVGNNEYKIKTGASNGSLVLNAVNGNNTAGDNVNQYSYDGSIKDEKWKIYQDASGNYVFVSSTGDKVLDICGKKMANNTNIWLWEYYGASTQKWKLNAVKSANDTPTISSLKPVTIDNGWYKITSSANSNLAIEVQGGTNANGANIYGNTKNNSKNQEFYFEQISGNEYAIKTAVSDKARALDVVGGNSANGINVRQWDYSDRKAVHWKLYTDDEGNYVLVSSTGDKVLDLTGAKSTAGTNVWTWDYYGASTQKWKLNAVKSANDTPTISSLKPATIDNGWYKITSSANSNLAIEVQGGTNANGVNIYGNTKNGSNNQDFYFEQISGNEYAIKTAVSDKARALDVVGGNSANGINVRQWDYSDRKAVHWKLYTDDEGNYVLVSSTGDKVLDLTGAKSTAGTNVWTWDYYGASTQEWKLNKVEKSPISYLKQVTVSNGWYTFASVQDESYVLDVNGYSKNSNLRLYKKNDSENQKFYIESVGNNEYKIKTGASNGNLVLNAVNGNNTAGDNVNQYYYDGSIKDEKWKIYQDASGNYVFVSSTGDKVLDICGKKMANNTNIWLWNYIGVNTQKWKLNPVNLIEGQEIADGTYTIGLASNNNYVFDVSYCSSKNGTKIQLMNRNGNIAQLFRIKYEGNGEYTINTGASLYNSSVDILGGNTTNATINQWANNSLAPQRWKITKSGNGYVFRSVINENLVLDASGASNGASLTLATYNANDNTQKFTLTKGSGWLISGDRKYYFNENGNKPEVGIDVSYHNGTIDWQKVKDDNISYAIIRSGYRTEKTEGKRNIGKDVKFEENVANASKVGMEYGVYFYSTAVTIEEANEEADAIIAALKGKNPFKRSIYRYRINSCV